MTDYLAELPVQEVVAWYKRLADAVAERKINGQEPLASLFLRTWLTNRSPKYTLVFHSPSYLKAATMLKRPCNFTGPFFLQKRGPGSQVVAGHGQASYRVCKACEVLKNGRLILH